MDGGCLAGRIRAGSGRLGGIARSEGRLEHAPRGWVRDGAGLGAARPLLDGLALPRGAVGRRPGRGAPRLCRGGAGDRPLRAGDHDRPARAGRHGLALLRPRHHHARPAARRRLGARRRPLLPGRRCRRAGGCHLGLQRLGRAAYRLCPGRRSRAPAARACRRAPLRLLDGAGGGCDPGRRRGHLHRRHRAGARPQAQPRPDRGRGRVRS